MSNYRRMMREGGVFFFTVVMHQRRPLFQREGARRLLHQAIKSEQAKHPFEITAIVLLPDHLHCIWTLPKDDGDYSLRWANIKRNFSKFFLTAGGYGTETSRSKQSRHEPGVWQRRFWEHTIRDQQDFVNHMHYIHYNPVKHGLAKCPHLWPYSSFHRWTKAGHYQADWQCRCQDSGGNPPDFTHLQDTVGET